LAEKLVTEGREVLGIDLASEMLLGRSSQVPKVPNEAIIWIMTLVGVFSVILWILHFGGRDLALTVIPIGTAVAICVLFSFVAGYLTQPLSNFSPTTALITIVFVMEMGTFERFLIKNSLRALGTIAGALVAVFWAEVSSLMGHYMLFMVGVCFSVFTVDSVMAKWYKDVAYIFMMVSVTFALVFFGYMQKGWSAVWGRIISVVMGEIIAAICVVGFSMMSGEWRSAKSATIIVKKTDQIVKGTLVAVEFAFGRNIIHAHDDESGNGLKDIRHQSFRCEVKDFFRIDEAKSIEDLKASMESSSFSTFPVDTNVTALLNECRNAWADMQLVRGVIPYLCCGRQLFAQLPNIGLIFDRVHPLYVQASALAHSATIDPGVWQEEFPKVEAVREHLQNVQEPWSEICRLLVAALADTHHIMDSIKGSREVFLKQFKEITDALQASNICLTNVRKALPNLSQSLTGFDNSARNPLWRFDAFCQSLDIIIAELSSLACLQLKILRVDDDQGQSDAVVQTLVSLASMGARGHADLDEAKLNIVPETPVAFLEQMARPFGHEQMRRPFGRAYREEGNMAEDEG
jgi:hypothetical protein